MTVKCQMIKFSLTCFIARQLTFSVSSTATGRPKTSIQKSIPLVTGLEFHSHAKLVLVGWDGVCQARVTESFEDFFRTSTPAFMSSSDVCRRVIIGLEKIAGITLRSKIFHHELIVLSTRLKTCQSGIQILQNHKVEANLQ